MNTTKIIRKYMMATTATHNLGDISRTPVDICAVSKEDSDNFYGNWVYGYGFIDVRFPKSSTRDLSEEEITKYHGTIVQIGSGNVFPINLTGENFHKKVTVTKKETSKEYHGVLISPIKIGQPICFIRDDNGSLFTSTLVRSIDGNQISTKNSIYTVEYTQGEMINHPAQEYFASDYT